MGQDRAQTVCHNESFIHVFLTISYFLQGGFLSGGTRWAPETGAYSWLRGSCFLKRYLRSDLRWKQGIIMMMTRIDFLLLSCLCCRSSVSFISNNVDVCRTRYCHPRQEYHPVLEFPASTNKKKYTNRGEEAADNS